MVLTTCLNQRFDGDLDPADGLLPGNVPTPFLEIGLRSDCDTSITFIQTFMHSITNHSAFETYNVTWSSPDPGIAVPALRPGGRKLVTRTSLLSCTERDLGAVFIRVAPRPAPPFNQKVAPACVPGWLILKELKDIFGLLSSAAGGALIDPEPDDPFLEFKTPAAHAGLLPTKPFTRDSVTLTSRFDDQDMSTGETSNDFMLKSHLQLAEDGKLWRYRMSFANNTGRPATFFADAFRSPEGITGWDGHLGPHEDCEIAYDLPVDQPENDPVEMAGMVSVFDGCGRTQFGVSGLVPSFLADGLIEAPAPAKTGC